LIDSNLVLSKSAQSVQDVLSQKGLKFSVVELVASTRTANDAAETIGCSVGQIVKSIIFRTKETNRAILVLVSGINRVNEQTLEKQVGEKIVQADADFTRKVTGFAIGGVPPIGHSQLIYTFIDEDLLKLKELWAAAGTPNAVFSLNASDLESLTGGKVISIQ
jgi:prolyl-tRNA editing enzyme YbaK/EbsC (Cys-tRNA(Pro) deacylase)